MPARRTAAVVFVLVTVAVVGPPLSTSAFLQDSDSSAQNPITAGTIDLKLAEVGPASHDSTTDESGADTVYDTWEDYDHSTDGSDTVNNTLTLNNSHSSLAVDTINVTVSYAENDTSLGTSGNENKTARTITIDAFVYNGTDLVGTELTDQNGNGKVDVEDLILGSNTQNLSTLDGMGPSDSVNLTVRFSGNSDVLSGPGSGDGIDIEFEIRAANATFVDRDAATDSTIQYG